MAHVPTIIEKLEELKIVKFARATWTVGISVVYEDGPIKRRGQWFNLNELEHMTDQEVMHSIMSGIEGDVVP